MAGEAQGLQQGEAWGLGQGRECGRTEAAFSFKLSNQLEPGKESISRMSSRERWEGR